MTIADVITKTLRDEVGVRVAKVERMAAELTVHALAKDSDYGERGTEALREWYNNGADGAINWGEPGDFEACIAVASKYIDNPEGYCNERHQDATGAPPGHAPGEEAEKAAKSDWAKHPNHALHDKIVAYYTPKIATALKNMNTNVRAAITSAQNKYAAAQAKTKKAGEDVAAGETLAQQIARAAASGIGASQSELKQLLGQMTADSYLAGVRSAITQLGSMGTVPADLADAYDAVNWDTWEPGSEAAAATIRSAGLQAVLDQIPATLDGITDTNVTRIGNAIADGLSAGDSVQTMSTNIGDMVGGVDDSRALMIANTETARAMSTANMDTYDAAGIEQYNWLAEDDDKTCIACEDNEDNGPYDVGGDDSPTVPQHTNCRCTYLAVVPGADTGTTGEGDNG
jgi:SPP1 gp7 family putative phage head morphogenesis protein